jgi:hypothetical protein
MPEDPEDPEVREGGDVWERAGMCGRGLECVGEAGTGGKVGDEDRCEIFIAYIREEHNLE